MHIRRPEIEVDRVRMATRGLGMVMVRVVGIVTVMMVAMMMVMIVAE